MSAVDSTNPHQFSYDPETDVAFRTLDFLGFPGYRVGDDGSVWKNWNRHNGVLKHTHWTQIRFSTRWGHNPKNGRRYVQLHMTSLSRQYAYAKTTILPTHQIVLMAFCGPKPPGWEGCHRDGDATNNRLGNLRWDTHLANAADAVAHGTYCRGESNGAAKYTAELVTQVRLAAEGMRRYGRYTTLGRMFGVPPSAIRDFLNFKSWRHLDHP